MQIYRPYDISMEISSFTFFLTLFFLKNFPLSSSRTIPNFTTDQSALLAFRNSITSDNGILPTNWSTNTPICNWSGVTCGRRHNRVISLNVSGLALRGNLTPHLGNLTFLRTLDISSNNFTGSVPSELSKLRRLTYINMGTNNFGGEIQSWFEALSQLQYLHLNNNTFSGKIPSSLFNISSLIEINMRYNKLSGVLPNDICSNTPKLEAIYLSGNQLSGQIPANIYKCRELQDLRLPSNKINGSIPSEIGSLSMLRTLNLFTNELEGSIPEQFGNLTSLQYLNLGMNKLTGPISKQFGNMTSLTALHLSPNGLAGELPKELGNLPFLETLVAGFNFLNGPIPPSIFNISSLMELALQQNNFTGSLPPYMGLSLPNLEQLYLFLNKLSGQIPSSINNASRLTIIELNRNSFTGPIPDLSNLRFLEHLRVWENNLAGADSPSQELGFISSLTNCPNLVSLEMTDNPGMSGVLPPSIGNLSTSFQTLTASLCDIRGEIPSEIGNLSSLLGLHLSENQLTGFIPSTLAKAKQLQRLYLGDNRLQGEIPQNLCQLSNLGELNLSYNMFTGSLHECWGEVKALRKVSFASNKINSVIPLKFWDLTDLTTLDLHSNNLRGEISSQIEKLKSLDQLDLSSNQFSEEIPSSIGNCQSLVFLSLSNNSLSGSIPKSLEALPSLVYFNVSYNKLEGEIPNGGPFANFTAESFLHNSALCGTARFQVPPCKKDKERSNNSGRLVKYIVPPFISAIVLVIIIVIFIRRYKQKKIPPQVDFPPLKIDWRRISYIELERGTSSFNETKLLGRGSFGSVFKGVLSDGLNVAVKVFNLDLEKATKSFDTESEILSSVRHRNLVQIIGCCVNTEFRALVLAYMPNGNLENWLHSDSYFLDLVQRLHIAIDVALGLEYLHHGHTFVVVHCDIKPSNVLLDEDMVAHVCDFGISKLFDEGEAMVQTKTLATIGYAAPEYGSEGKVSTNGDVYSYGILLLEIFTRKKPTDDMFSGEMDFKMWVSEALREDAITEVMDPGLLSNEDPHLDSKVKCVSSVLELAMKCLASSPEERIDMVEVVNTLEKIKVTAKGGDHTRRRS